MAESTQDSPKVPRAKRRDAGRARIPRPAHLRGRAAGTVEREMERVFAEGRASVITELETAILGGSGIDDVLCIVNRIRGEARDG